MIKSINIYDSKNDNKRLTAVFTLDDGRTLTRHFGSPDAYTYYDGAHHTKRENYIKRHSRLAEDWNDITTPGALSRYILWESRNNSGLTKILKTRFNIKNIKLNITKN